MIATTIKIYIAARVGISLAKFVYARAQNRIVVIKSKSLKGGD